MSQWALRALFSENTPILSLRAINSLALLFPVPSPLVIINGPRNCNLQTDAEAVAAERRPKLDRRVRVENRSVSWDCQSFQGETRIWPFSDTNFIFYSTLISARELPERVKINAWTTARLWKPGSALWAGWVCVRLADKRRSRSRHIADSPAALSAPALSAPSWQFQGSLHELAFQGSI